MVRVFLRALRLRVLLRWRLSFSILIFWSWWIWFSSFWACWICRYLAGTRMSCTLSGPAGRMIPCRSIPVAGSLPPPFRIPVPQPRRPGGRPPCSGVLLCQTRTQRLALGPATPKIRHRGSRSCHRDWHACR